MQTKMPKLQRFFVVAALIAGLPASAQSAVQLQQQQKAHDENAGPPFPLHATASLTHSIGSGTFVTGSGNNPTLASALTLTPLASYKGFTFIANQSFGFEYTQSDYTSAANQVEMSDLSLAARYTKLSAGDFNFIPTVSYVVPLSLTSRNFGSVGNFGAGLRAGYSLNDYGLSFYGTLTTGYTGLVPALSQRFRNNPSKPFVDDSGKSLKAINCSLRNDIELSSYACSDGALPSVWRWGTGVGANWSILEGQLSFSLDLGLAQGFSVFFGPDDEFTADNARKGWTPRQSSSGNLSATYAPTSWFFLTGGINSQQGLFTNNCFASDANAADECVAGKVSNEHLRFPLWDFETPRDNNSSIYVDTTFSF